MQEVPDKLEKIQSSIKQIEEKSVLKLSRVESFKEDVEVRDMLIDKDSALLKSSTELEPFLLQMPATLPFFSAAKAAPSSLE